MATECVYFVRLETSSVGQGSSGQVLRYGSRPTYTSHSCSVRLRLARSRQCVGRDAGSKSQATVSPGELAEYKVLPSLLKLSARTLSTCLTSRGPNCCFVATSQRTILLSSLPDASVVPSGVNASVITGLRCDVSGGASCLPVSASQKRMVLSPLPVARVFPSGLTRSPARNRCVLRA